MHRNLLLSRDGSYLVVWSLASENEVYPWAANLNDEDRANILVYSIKNFDQSVDPRRLGFLRTNSDPLAIRYSGHV